MNEATMTVRVDKAEKSLISDFAKMKGVSASRFIRECVLRDIEDQIDVQAYLSAKEEYDKNPAGCSLDDAERILGL